MADLEETRRACEQVEAAWTANRNRPAGDALTVLHCTSAYPTPFDDVNLRAMNAMAAALGHPVGYSDHTVGILVPPVAVALGATVIEKHVTLDRSMEGPDHSASIEPDELKAMIEAIRNVEAMLGDGVKAPRASELEARRLVRRGLKAARDLSPGTVLAADDIAILRPATGLPPGDLQTAIGARLSRALPAGAPITAQDLVR
jgi:sialic acid synthase SpsE